MFDHQIILFSHSSSEFHDTLMPKNSQFVPPALPPKKHKISSSNASLNSITTPPTSPKISNDDVFTDNSKRDEMIEVKSSAVRDSSVSEGNQNFAKGDETDNGIVVLRKKASGMVESTSND